ncbi:MAG TPA: flagellar biosynthesis anti-sigma factor FlgM [Steroidobacteraceae bacterium]
MTAKISDIQNPQVQTGAHKRVTNVRDGAAAAAETPAASGSAVKITDQARQLASLEHTVQSLPVVNESRVASISKAIDEGRYQVNPERIADKLLRTESELSDRS